VNYKELTHRAVKGLKHIGSFRRVEGNDPHSLDCSLAGRVCHVFGVGMTRAHDICIDAGEDPDYRELHCESCDALDADLDEVGFCNDCAINADHGRASISDDDDDDE
jgi:hypothetical protein